MTLQLWEIKILISYNVAIFNIHLGGGGGLLLIGALDRCDCMLK